MSSKVSICIPAYNSVASIRKLLDSIELQTYKDYEIIITDDSSTDDVRKYVESLNNDRIHYYKNTHQLGAARNCNEAISKASGEYVKLMHHDDWFTDNSSLESFVKMLDDNEDADIAFSGTNQVSANNTFSRSIADRRVKALSKSYRTLYYGNWIGAPSATIMRNKDYFFDINLKWLVDIELYMRILRKKPDFIFTKEPLVSIGVNEEQLTNSCEHDWELNKREYLYVIKKLKLYMYWDCIFVYIKLYAMHIWKVYIKKEYADK